MACLQKIGKAYKLTYYLNGTRHFKTFSKDTPKAVVLAEKKRIEAEIALHKSKIRPFSYNADRVDQITIIDFYHRISTARRHEVSPHTLKRNLYALRLLIDVVGQHMPIARLTQDHFEQFRSARYEHAISQYQKKKWKFDETKIAAGINKEFSNIRATINYAVKKGIIPVSIAPSKYPFYRLQRKRLPYFFSDEEIHAVAANLSGQALLAFWILRYTGARRSEIVRYRLNDDRGLRWKDIDWMRNTIRVYSKGSERFIPIHSDLRAMLIEHQKKCGDLLDREAPVISLIGDTLTTYFSRAKKKAGITKAGSVHILRHTAATAILKATGNLRVTQEFLGHKNIETTAIYAHIVKEEVAEAVNKAFNSEGK